MNAPRYAAYYCEENVWWLAQEARFVDRGGEVVIVSNESRTVAVSAQRASASGEPVVWDYHVVLAVDAEIWDLDCVLGIPIPIAAWIDASFDERAPPRLAPRFRVMASREYVAAFASDRRHMRMPDGTWQAPPPSWPIIGGGAHELDRFIDPGGMIDLAALRARWR